MIRSPGLCSSTHALIFGSLVIHRERMVRTAQASHIPLVLLTDVILLAEVDEVNDWLGGEQLQAVDDVDLGIRVSIVLFEKRAAGW